MTKTIKRYGLHQFKNNVKKQHSIKKEQYSDFKSLLEYHLDSMMSHYFIITCTLMIESNKERKRLSNSLKRMSWMYKDALKILKSIDKKSNKIEFHTDTMDGMFLL